MIARALGTMPGVKRVAKRIYAALNAITHRKNYRSRVFIPGEGLSFIPGDGESFYGYYDHSPERSGRVLWHNPEAPTHSKPEAGRKVSLMITDNDGTNRVLGTTFSYNWQQGARLLWVDDDRVIWNEFRNGGYSASLYSLGSGRCERHYNRPVQELWRQDTFLSVNPQRIMAVSPDYGYRNIQALDGAALHDGSSDGIWRVWLADGHSELIHSLDDIAAAGGGTYPADAIHTANHVMASPDMQRFIFIHRWYDGHRRHDRLLVSDNGKLRVLAQEDMVSHLCWTDNDTVFGYLRNNGTDGFYYINVASGETLNCAGANALGQGDGHPTAWGDWIAFDSYPDRSRMQHLTLMRRSTGETFPVLELHHSLRYYGETRCDLHPRFTDDGRYIWTDTVCGGRRALARVDVSQITHKQ